jgi:hypothetical protein
MAHLALPLPHAMDDQQPRVQEFSALAKTNDGTVRTSILTVNVAGNWATLEVTDADEAPLWSKEVPWTDFPEGMWPLCELGSLEFDASGCRSIAAVVLSEQVRHGQRMRAPCLAHGAQRRRLVPEPGG